MGKPGLVGQDDHHRPMLKGVRCQACHEVAFPPQHHGCERCGATHLTDVDLSADGAVLGSAAVHIHAKPYPPVPFTVVEVRLDAGPVVRALLNGSGPAPRAGQRVHGVLREGAEAGVLDFQFEMTA
ncbi:hypothetical protein CCO03_13435 [Comamonas serinivorans]|uniref:DUF35 domain-containing protein n=1 Tax=Comamonas serinivorans TaxID=1082851 RepID=A0A1Y0EQG5_9BURK|nr:hypothetical protein [Comamonas serinivorans]ARU05549.1 hypothetical protein CCO03_13435 [Comamonas serinivorans]